MCIKYRYVSILTRAPFLLAKQEYLQSNTYPFWRKYPPFVGPGTPPVCDKNHPFRHFLVRGCVPRYPIECPPPPPPGGLEAVSPDFLPGLCCKYTDIKLSRWVLIVWYAFCTSFFAAVLGQNRPPEFTSDLSGLTISECAEAGKSIS